MTSHLDDIERYRRNAAELREKAAAMKDPIARQTMSHVARGYDDMAAQLERLGRLQVSKISEPA